MQVEALQELALRISGERNVHTVHQHIVAGLVQQSGVALARVWVVEPGDICSVLPHATFLSRPDQMPSLGGQRGIVLDRRVLVAKGRRLQTDAAWAPQGRLGGVQPHRLTHRGSTLGEMGASGMG